MVHSAAIINENKMTTQSMMIKTNYWKKNMVRKHNLEEYFQGPDVLDPMRI